MTKIPNEESELFLVIIKSSLRCGVHLIDMMNSNKYYLNKVDGKYELIIDRTIPNGMVGKECDYCIERVTLNLN